MDTIGAAHATPASEVLAALGVSARGLSMDEARLRLARDGPNVLRPPRRITAAQMIAAQLRSPVVLLLLVAVVLTVATRQWLDAGAIAAELLLNATIGVAIELRARRALEALLGDERLVELPAGELVVGDVVRVEAGRRVPADARLLEAVELQTGEAILTGESAPVAKDAGAVLAPDTPVAERATMLYQATGVTRGHGVAVVVATGMAT
ncbi:MAG: hypothetical protein HOQ11_00170, partial [Gemmatimonadaceae bacterium]|nr:hypothetical protein [Gemmatimonadaceae bacterium]